MRRDMHIGTTRRGERLHLAAITEEGTGFSKCGRRMDGELWAVAHCEVGVDDPWCGSCLNKEVRDGVSWAELDYKRAQRGEGLFRVYADERSPVGNDGGDA
jgi:hypothetical protein